MTRRRGPNSSWRYFLPRTRYVNGPFCCKNPFRVPTTLNDNKANYPYLSSDHSYRVFVSPSGPDFITAHF